MQDDDTSSRCLPAMFFIILLVPRWFSGGWLAEGLSLRPGLHCCTSWWRTQANQGLFRHWLSPNPKLMTLLLLPMTIQRCFFCSFRHDQPGSIRIAWRCWQIHWISTDLSWADPQDQKVFAITGTFSIFAYLLGPKLERGHVVSWGLFFGSRCLQRSPKVPKGLQRSPNLLVLVGLWEPTWDTFQVQSCFNAWYFAHMSS